MANGNSDIDRKNFAWMNKDTTRATLCKIHLLKGSLRGLGPFKMDLKYPITAIAGGNGSGKSTLLAIAACAYHNYQNGYVPTGRRTPYYTFSDFFIQSRDETPPAGIEIGYQFLHNRLRNRDPDFRWQNRKKKVNGKWNEYRTRIKRNVIYFGIQRVVPHNELTTHKSYRRHFEGDSLNDKYRREICEIASRIIGRPYNSFEKRTHSKYSLPVATTKGVRYSGFNMGSGESAVFDILSSLFEAGPGSLLIIDEIELGLHEQAQQLFLEELKKLCNKLKCQVICSTHSHVVLNTLPPEGRYFLESSGNQTILTPGISPDFACGRLRGDNIGELDIFVEDNVAETILKLGLPHSLRKRINITPIGSAHAIIRLMASRYLENRDNFLCILDGDKRAEDRNNKSSFRGYAEVRYRESENEMMLWAENHLTYLPSNSTPERWLIQSCQSIAEKSSLANSWNLEDTQILENAFEKGNLAPAHAEMFTLSKEIQLPTDRLIGDIAGFLVAENPRIFKDIEKLIIESLGDGTH